MKKCIKYVFVFVAIVLFIFCISAGILAIIQLKRTNSIENYIEKANDILYEINSNSTSLVSLATGFVSFSQEKESNLVNGIDETTLFLTEIKNQRDSAKEQHDAANVNLTSLKKNANSLVGYVETAYLALTNIKNYVNGTSNTTNPGYQFADAYVIIQTNQDISKNAYNDTLFAISEIYRSYNANVKIYESDAVNSINYCYERKKELETYISDLTINLSTSIEYSNLNSSVDKAKILSVELEPIRLALSGDDQTLIANLIANLDTATTEADKYLQNSSYIFQLATDTANTNMSTYFTQLTQLFSEINEVIGTLTQSYPESVIATPVVINSSSNTSIVYYYNSIQEIITSMVPEYNRAITSYNTVIGYVNEIKDLVDGITSEVTTNINILNTELSQAAEIMKDYFPGSTTPAVLGPVTMPVTQTPLPTMTTVPPYTYLPMSIKYS